jgi:hypothetical protein
MALGNKRLCKSIDRISSDIGAAYMPIIDEMSKDFKKKKTRKVVVRDVKNNTKTSKKKGAMYGHKVTTPNCDASRSATPSGIQHVCNSDTNFQKFPMAVEEYFESANGS